MAIRLYHLPVARTSRPETKFPAWLDRTLFLGIKTTCSPAIIYHECCFITTCSRTVLATPDSNLFSNHAAMRRGGSKQATSSSNRPTMRHGGSKQATSSSNRPTMRHGGLQQPVLLPSYHGLWWIAAICSPPILPCGMVDCSNLFSTHPTMRHGGLQQPVLQPSYHTAWWIAATFSPTVLPCCMVDGSNPFFNHPTMHDGSLQPVLQLFFHAFYTITACSQVIIYHECCIITTCFPSITP
jgi:hypothetical protein